MGSAAHRDTEGGTVVPLEPDLARVRRLLDRTQTADDPSCPSAAQRRALLALALALADRELAAARAELAGHRPGASTALDALHAELSGLADLCGQQLGALHRVLPDD